MHRSWTFQRRQDRAPAPRGGRTVEVISQQRQQDLAKAKVNTCKITTLEDESSKPYCFTLNKLVNLRKIEIVHISGSDVDWETLERALLAIEYGDSSGVTRDTFEANSTKRPNKIRELCLQFQGESKPILSRILSYFGGLEVLQINATESGTQNHPWLSNWDPALCKNLKALRVGLMARLVTDPTSLHDLGRFCRLEELHIQLKKLCLTLTSFDLGPKLHHTLEALGTPHLEELVVTIHGAGVFITLPNNHRLPNLRRLSFRSRFLSNIDYHSIAQACPQLESLVVQQPKYSQPAQFDNSNEKMVDSLPTTASYIPQHESSINHDMRHENDAISSDRWQSLKKVLFKLVPTGKKGWRFHRPLDLETFASRRSSGFWRGFQLEDIYLHDETGFISQGTIQQVHRFGT
ncbi:MAG: hypothetical protein J3R72DRAFT_474451, partial [Linnemannia gamsii]